MRASKKQEPRPRSPEPTVDTGAVRIAALREGIGALLRRNMDALTDTEDIRAMAIHLRIPYLALKFIEQEDMNPSSRCVTIEDIEEWCQWAASHPKAAEALLSGCGA